MSLYLLRRAVWACVLVLVVTFVMYVLFFVAPIGGLSVSGRYDDVRLADSGSTQDDEQPALAEYVGFLGDLAHGNFGTSWRSQDEVGDMIGQAVPATASLVLGGMVLWLVVAFSLGIYSAVRPRSLVDRVGSGFVLFGISAHPLWLGLVLAWLLGYVVEVFPIQGYCDFIRPSDASECGGPVQWAYHLVLPWIVFASAFAALYARMIRSSLAETLKEDYITAARARGVPERSVLRKHALRNGLIPIVTMLAMDLGIAFGSTLFIERIFQIPGLGFMVANALPRRDMPVILGVIVFVSLLIVLCNLLVDLLYGILDPRVSGLAASKRRVVRDAPVPAGEPSAQTKGASASA